MLKFMPSVLFACLHNHYKLYVVVVLVPTIACKCVNDCKYIILLPLITFFPYAECAAGHFNINSSCNVIDFILAYANLFHVLLYIKFHVFNCLLAG